MTTESTITTSVDAEVTSLDEKIKALQSERSDLATKQTEERAEQQREKFNDLVGSPSAILKATKIDLDALKAIGVTGFTVSVKPDPDGGPEVLSVAPVTARVAKAKASGNSSGGPRKDLLGNFEATATDEERTAMAKVLEDGGDGNAVFALRLKVWNRTHSD